MYMGMACVDACMPDAGCDEAKLQDVADLLGQHQMPSGQSCMVDFAIARQSSSAVNACVLLTCEEGLDKSSPCTHQHNTSSRCTA